MNRKILTILGVRPHFIKAVMVSKAIRETAELEEVVVHTGQHYDRGLSQQFFEELELPRPKYHLEIGSGRQAWQVGTIIVALDKVIEQEQPDLVIVYGDTNSTAAGAIAAAKNSIPLAHIEAGLREFDKRIPEEVNKLLTDAVTDLYFCPTATGVQNLKKAGITKHVYQVGDVGIDLIHHHIDRIRSNEAVLEKYQLEKGEYFLMTCHRAANTENPEHLRAILSTIPALENPVIFPMHPRTQQAIERYHLQDLLNAKKLIITPPLGFWDTQTLLQHAHMAITDSGGIIKEAYFHKTPAVIIDRQTEWVETVTEGWNQVAGPDSQKILSCIRNFEQPVQHSNCLGDGTAAHQIVTIILDFLS